MKSTQYRAAAGFRRAVRRHDLPLRRGQDAHHRARLQGCQPRPGANCVWRKQYPKCLWGMPTGRTTGFFVWTWTSSRNAASTATKRWRNCARSTAALPESAEAMTPSGGKHIYFAHPPDVHHEIICRSAKGEIGSGIDIRADGGYVIVPPSRVNGHAYEWEASADPAEVGFAQAPAWLVDLARADAPKSTPGKQSTEAGAIRRALDGIRTGSPLHDSLRMAVAVVARGFRFDDACALLRTLLEASSAPRDVRASRNGMTRSPSSSTPRWISTARPAAPAILTRILCRPLPL